MALNVGTLSVTLGADTSAFLRNLDSAVKAFDRTAKQLADVGGKFANVAGAMSAVGLGALALAAQVDGPAKRSLDELSKSTQLLAVQVADTLRPALHEASRIITGLANAFALLSPEQKKAIADFAVTVVQVAAVAKAVQLAATGFSALSGAAQLVGALASGPLLVVVAVVATLGAAAALAYRAWKQNFGGIQETTGKVVQAISDAFFWLVDAVARALKAVLDAYQWWLNKVLDGVAALQAASGLKVVDVEGIRAGLNGVFTDLRSGQMLKDAVQLGKRFAAAVGEGVSMIASDLGLSDIIGKLRAGLGGQQAPGLITPRGSGGGGGKDKQVVSAMDFIADRRLESLAKEAAEQERILADQERILAKSKLEWEAAARAQADAARASSEMARAAGELAKAQREAAERATSGTLGRVAGVASYGGEAGGVAAKILQGFQGGLDQGILTAVMEFVGRMKSFAAVTQGASKVLDTLVAAVEPLLRDAFLGLGLFLEQALVPLLQGLQPIFEAFGEAFSITAVVFQTLGPILAGLAPVLGLVASLFRALAPLFTLLSDVLLRIMQVVGSVVLGLVRGILTVWNGIIEAIAWVVGLFSAQAAADVRKLSADVKAVDKAITDLNAMSPESLRAEREALAAKLANNDATDKATKTVQEFAQSFSNLPSGYNTNFALYTVGGGGGLNTLMSGDSGTGTTNTTIIIEKVEVKDADDLVDKLERLERQRNAQRTGNPTRRDDL